MHKSLSIKIGAALLLMLFLLGGCGKAEDYVAKVNGELITRSEFDKRVESTKALYELQGFSFEDAQGQFLEKLLEQEVLQQLIREKVLEQEIEKQGIKIDKQKAEEQVTSIEEIYGKESFEELLKAQKTTRKELIDQVAFQLALDELYQKVTADVKVTEEEAEAYFNEHQDDFIQIKVSHILASAEKDSATAEERKEAERRAQNWIERLKAGEDFVELAKKESDEPGAETSGGSLGGYFSKKTSSFVPEFTEAAFKLKKGAFSDKPVETDFGYHVIKVDDRKDTFAQLKDEVIETLTLDKKNEKFNSFVSGLIEKANIENKLAEETNKAGETKQKDLKGK